MRCQHRSSRDRQHFHFQNHRRIWYQHLVGSIGKKHQISCEFDFKFVLFKSSTYGISGIECSCLMDTTWSISGCGWSSTAGITSISVVTVGWVVLIQLSVSPWVDQILLLFVQAIKYVIVDSISVWITIGYG